MSDQTEPSDPAKYGGNPLPAVLVDRFGALPFSGGVVLSLFGVGRTRGDEPLSDLIPAFTAFLTPKRAAEMAQILANAVTALTTLSADEGKPQ